MPAETCERCQGKGMLTTLYRDGKSQTFTAVPCACLRAMPVHHEPVLLSEEGAKIRQQVMGPASPAGKPINYRRRCL